MDIDEGSFFAAMLRVCLIAIPAFIVGAGALVFFWRSLSAESKRGDKMMGTRALVWLIIMAVLILSICLGFAVMAYR